MNGFKVMADSYRALVKEGKLSESDAKREIEVYEFLATCNRDDFYRFVDSSAFNDIIKSFCRKALRCAKVGRDTEEKVMDELRWLFDAMGAKQVCDAQNEE